MKNGKMLAVEIEARPEGFEAILRPKYNPKARINEVSGTGRTVQEALGDLVFKHSGTFNLGFRVSLGATEKLAQAQKELSATPKRSF